MVSWLLVRSALISAIEITIGRDRKRKLTSLLLSLTAKIQSWRSSQHEF
jgi:hypothetical protein